VASLLTARTTVITIATLGVIGSGGIFAGHLKDTSIADTHALTSVQAIEGTAYDLTTTAEEHWYYYPPGSKDVVMIQVRPIDNRSQGYCQWLQNQHGNYFRNKGRITIENYRWWHPDLSSVMRLPTDSPSLTDFLDQIQGTKSSIGRVRLSPLGMLVVYRGSSVQRLEQITLRRDVSDEEYFRYHWPVDNRIRDLRDPMHQRGWTYFRVSGHVQGHIISGGGCIPFVYSALNSHTPWIYLKVTDMGSFIDNNTQALQQDETNRIIGVYMGGTFLKGLSRPWQGLHTIDTIRRDAAEAQIPFETHATKKTNYIDIHVNRDDVWLVFRVDMTTDVLDDITFFHNQRQVGRIHLEYIQDAVSLKQFHLTKPAIRRQRRLESSEPGMEWLFRLADGSFNEHTN
jgi:hypothetical protein